MNEIVIKMKGDGKLSVASPYNPAFAPGAKRLGGRWSAATKAWQFDPRDEQRVRELCRSVYGTDGSPSEAGDLVTIRVTAPDGWDVYGRGLYIYGRQVAWATGRDSGARLCDGVIVLKGSFDSGGSMKNWMTVCKPGTVFELRDLPRKALELDKPGCLQVEVIEAGNPPAAAPESAPVNPLESVDLGMLLYEAQRRLREALTAPAETGDVLVDGTNVSALCRLAGWHAATATDLLKLAGVGWRSASTWVEYASTVYALEHGGRADYATVEEATEQILSEQHRAEMRRA